MVHWTMIVFITTSLSLSVFGDGRSLVVLPGWQVPIQNPWSPRGRCLGLAMDVVGGFVFVV